MDDAIQAYLKRKYNLAIGEQTAERIKIEIGSAYPGQQVKELSVWRSWKMFPTWTPSSCPSVAAVSSQALPRL